MALSVKKGTITTARTTAGNQAYTGVGFQPKALIFFATAKVSTGMTLQAPSALGFVASTTQRAAISGYSDFDTGGESNATATQLGTSNTGKDTRVDSVITLLWGGDPVTNAVADLVSFDADGFTLGWTDPANVATRIIHYMALGGDDLTDVAVTSHAVVRTTAGTEAYSGAGFQPDCVLFMSASPQATAGSAAADDTVCFGWANKNPSAAIEQSSITWFDDDAGNTMSCFIANYSNSCLCLPGATAAADGRAAMSSFDSDGFTLNWTDPVAATTGRTFYALSLKGPQFKTGAQAKPTSNGAQNITGQPFQPKGVFFTMTGLTTDNSSSAATADSFFGLGATDGTADGTITNLQIDANTNSNARSAQSTTRTLHAITGTTGADAGDYDVTALNSDGFSGTWANANATAYRWYWLAMGDAGASPVVVTPSAAIATGSAPLAGVSVVSVRTASLALGSSPAPTPLVKVLPNSALALGSTPTATAVIDTSTTVFPSAALALGITPSPSVRVSLSPAAASALGITSSPAPLVKSVVNAAIALGNTPAGASFIGKVVTAALANGSTPAASAIVVIPISAATALGLTPAPTVIAGSGATVIVSAALALGSTHAPSVLLGRTATAALANGSTPSPSGLVVLSVPAANAVGSAPTPTVIAGIIFFVTSDFVLRMKGSTGARVRGQTGERLKGRGGGDVGSLGG